MTTPLCLCNKGAFLKVRKMKGKTRIIFNGVLCTIALLALGIFFTRLILFKPHDYFYVQHPNIQKYVGVNVVSRHADFAFFTYHTILFFAVWLILFSLSNLFAWKKLNAFVRKREVVSFVFVNYVITCALYTFFELTSGNITFGYYGNTPSSIFNLITNIFNHYLLFFLSVAIFLKVQTAPEEKSNGIQEYFIPSTVSARVLYRRKNYGCVLL